MAVIDVTNKDVVTIRPAYVSKGKTGGCIVTVAAKARKKAGFEHGDFVEWTCPKPGQLLMTKLEAPKEGE